jgi:hypothetical protein
MEIHSRSHVEAGNSEGRKGEKGRGRWGEYDLSTLYPCMKIKPENLWKLFKEGRGVKGEIRWRVLCTCVEASQ